MTTIRRAVIPLSVTIVLGLTGLLSGCAGPAVAGSAEPITTEPAAVESFVVLADSVLSDKGGVD